MEEEFTRSIYWKIFYSMLSVGFALFIIILTINSQLQGQPLLLLLPFVLTLFAVLVIINQLLSKIIISAERITRVTVFGKRVIDTSNVKGYRIKQKTIFIEPSNTSDHSILVNNYDDFNDIGDMIKWVKENFTDLDAADLQHEKDKITENAELGLTKEQREQNLSRTKRIAIAYNIIGVAFTFITIPFNNKITTLLLLLYPLLGTAVILTSSGLTKFVSSSKRSVYSFIMLGFTLPAFTLLISALFTYEIDEYQHVWLPFFAVASLIFTLVYKIGINKALPLKGQLVIIAIASLIYSYGSIIQVNCKLDRSDPRLIHTSVDNKWIEYNKGRHYHLKLKSWDSNPKPKDIEVSVSTFQRYAVSNNINVYLKRGFLEIPWYYLPDKGL